MGIEKEKEGGREEQDEKEGGKGIRNIA